MKHEQYMTQALRLAQEALQRDEVPVGCVIVFNYQIIGQGFNTRESEQNVMTHAEINAIKEASEKMNSWRLDDCDLYVTLEPCMMCAGAISQARIKNVYFGAFDTKSGVYGSVIDVSQIQQLNHHTNVYGGLCQDEAQEILKAYFMAKREEEA